MESTTPLPLSHSPTLGRVAILGLGLIGGSLARALVAGDSAESVIGWDSDSETLDAAIRESAIHRAASGPEDAVESADLIVFATPIESTIPLLKSVHMNLKDSAIVTDTGSAKSRIVKESEAILGGRFV